MKRATAILALMLTFGLSACNSSHSNPASHPGSTTILIVRHAEKASDAEDSPLTETGILRAQALVRAAEDAGVSAIYSSQFRRSIDTARPLSDRIGVAITEVPVNLASPGDYGELLAKQIIEKYRGQTIVVVGHSNTIASIIEGLARREAPVDNIEYSDMFIVTVQPSGGAGIIKTQYGLKYGG